jgi:hypothetical protein
MIVISFAKQSSCEVLKIKDTKMVLPKVVAKIEDDSIVQHAMAILVQMVNGDC